MRVVQGRDNLSVTVYVPFDCENNCKFCSSKSLYKEGSNLDKVREQLKKVRNSNIKEVVFTGGEPGTNVDVLKGLINIVDNKDVYINTSLIEKDGFKFINLINSTDCIKGVNISRHGESIEKDNLNNIVQDEAIKLINKPVKINVVMDLHYHTPEVVIKILDRWNSLLKTNITVSLRQNYNNTNLATLFNTNDDIIQGMSIIANYIDRTYCSVCHTLNYKYKNIKCNIHRGLSTTSITIGNTLEVNDIIITPLGELYYDWNYKNEYIEDVENQFYIKSLSDRNNINVKTSQYRGCGYSPIGRC